MVVKISSTYVSRFDDVNNELKKLKDKGASHFLGGKCYPWFRYLSLVYIKRAQPDPGCDYISELGKPS